MDAYFERLTAEEPYWGRQRPELYDTYRAIARASILAELECLRDGARPPDELPEADLEFARGAARMGAQPTELGQAYRRGHACHWQAWFELVEAEEAGPRAPPRPAGPRVGLLLRLRHPAQPHDARPSTRASAT